MQRVTPIVYRYEATELVPDIVVILFPGTVGTVKKGRALNHEDEAMGIYASKPVLSVVLATTNLTIISTATVSLPAPARSFLPKPPPLMSNTATVYAMTPANSMSK